MKWVHNDFMYARFAGMRNTKTWSKSTFVLKYHEAQISVTLSIELFLLIVLEDISHQFLSLLHCTVLLYKTSSWHKPEDEIYLLTFDCHL